MGLTLVMMMAGRLGAEDERMADQAGRRGTIVLHVVNYAALPSAVLAEAMRRVDGVYDLIGVRIIWVEGELTVRKQQDDGLHLSVLLLSREMAEKTPSTNGVADYVLGQAHLPSGRASIFCHRIVAAPSAHKLLAIPLGAVIAHEVGHLVLRANSHSVSGIMRANVDVHGVHFSTFDRMQARAIRTTLAEPTTLVAGR